MRYKTMFISAVLSGALLLVLMPVHAENYAVVHNIQGEGFVQGGHDEQTQNLGLNIPLMEGDNVWTGAGGRIDVLLQDGNHVFLDANTRVEMDQLPTDSPGESRSLRLRLWKGNILLDIHIWTSEMPEYSVSTPSASVGPSSAGLFFIEVENVDRTRVSSLEGRCSVTGAGANVELPEGQMTYADYGYAPLAPASAERVSNDLLQFREANLPKRTSGKSAKYLPSNLDAYANDLDSSGDWNYTPDYGYVWNPSSVPQDWAPYSNGNWDWEPWGSTWVPNESWGWAPFHYGRWVFSVGTGWGWCPMPYFSPAWVSWYWGDDGWLGWCPLGFFGTPLWGPGGWWSCPVGNFYDHHWGPNVIHHRTAPPPTPINPRAPGSPGTLRNNGPRGSSSSINLPPQKVREFRDGRISAKDLGASLRDPVQNNRRTYPSVQPSPGGSPRREPGDNRTVRSGGAGQQPADGRRLGNESRSSRLPVEPRLGNESRSSRLPAEPRLGNESRSTRLPVEPRAPTTSRNAPRTPSYSEQRTTPRQPVSPPSTEGPRANPRQGREPVAPTYHEGRAPSGRPTYGGNTYNRPNNIPSRPPSGATMPDRRYSRPSQAPHYSSPRPSAPHYSAPRGSAPHYSAPSSPHYSAPHSSGGGSSSGGGHYSGGSHSSSGGHSSGGGHSTGGGGHHR